MLLVFREFPSYGERNKNALSIRLRSGQRNAEWKQQTVRLQLLFLYQMKKFHTSKTPDPQHDPFSGQELGSSNQQGW